MVKDKFKYIQKVKKNEKKWIKSKENSRKRKEKKEEI